MPDHGERILTTALAGMDQLAEQLKAGACPPEKLARVRRWLLAAVSTASQWELALHLTAYQGAVEGCLQAMASQKPEGE